MGTLIKLVDRVRMLDNDLIRLNQKLAMVLEYKTELEAKGLKLDDELEKVLAENRTQSQDFNSTGKK